MLGSIIELEIELLLPCNVIIYEADEAGKSVVAAVDESKALGGENQSDSRLSFY